MYIYYPQSILGAQYTYIVGNLYNLHYPQSNKHTLGARYYIAGAQFIHLQYYTLQAPNIVNYMNID